MRLDKLTSKFQLALAEAQSLAVGQDHQFVEPAHVMVALLDQQGGTVRGLLTKAGGNVNLLRSQLGDAVDRLPKVEGTGGEVHMSNELGRLFNITDKLAQERGDQYISSELFVLAALDAKSPLKAVMEQAGAVAGAAMSLSADCPYRGRLRLFRRDERDGIQHPGFALAATRRRDREDDVALGAFFVCGIHAPRKFPRLAMLSFRLALVFFHGPFVDLINS